MKKHSRYILYMGVLCILAALLFFSKEDKIEYDYVSSFSEGLAIVTKDQKSGFINREGMLEIPLIYDQCSLFKEDVSIVKIGELYGLINKGGKELLPVEFDNIYEWLDEENYIVEKNNLYGVYNIYLGTIIEPIYAKIIPGEIMTVHTTDSKMGLIDNKGNIILDPIYKEIKDINIENNRVVLKKDRLFYIADLIGNPMSDEIYRDINIFDDAAIIHNGNKYGIMDIQGKVIIEPKYIGIEWGKGGLVTVYDDKGKVGLVDALGNEVVEYKYDNIEPFTDGVACVRLNGKYGAINNKGEIIIPIEHDEGIGMFGDSISMCKVIDGKKKWAMYDFKGDCLTEFKYDEMINLYKGFAIVRNDELYGVIDKNGQEVIPLEYSNLRFMGHYFQGKINGKNVILDKNNDILNDSDFDLIERSFEGMISFQLNGKYGFMDKSFKEKIKPMYDEVGNFSEGVAPVKLNGKWMFIDYDGNRVPIL